MVKVLLMVWVFVDGTSGPAKTFVTKDMADCQSQREELLKTENPKGSDAVAVACAIVRKTDTGV